MIVALLTRIGLVRVVRDLKYVNGAFVPQPPRVRWPFSVSPWWIWRLHFLNGLRGLLRRPTYVPAMGDWFGVFRNKPGVVKWENGRLLPRRWGFYIVGFEFGDRG